MITGTKKFSAWYIFCYMYDKFILWKLIGELILLIIIKTPYNNKTLSYDVHSFIIYLSFHNGNSRLKWMVTLIETAVKNRLKWIVILLLYHEMILCF